MITKLKPGETPPQFIAASFDGSGWDEKWQYRFSIQQQVPFHTPQAQSDADAAQVTATYQDMLDAAMASSHAPILLGNHFDDWNNNAYTTALGTFLLNNCNTDGETSNRAWFVTIADDAGPVSPH